MDEVSCSQSLPEPATEVPKTAMPDGAGNRLEVCPAVHADSVAGDVPLEVGGEWGIGNADELRKLFAESLDRNPDLVVDLAGVQACDTTVLQLICSLRKTALQRGQRVRIVGLSAAVESAGVALGLPVREWTGDAGPGAEHFSAVPGEPSRGI